MDTSMVPLSCEHNGGQSGHTMHCEEQLRTTLHCDDKEKLRRKLALLQREYLRTAERLQRAERLDSVRSRSSRQDWDRRDPNVTSNPGLRPSQLIPNTISGTSPSASQCQGHTGAPANSDASRRSPVIRFLFPSDAACPQTLDPSHDPAKGHRPSPSLRLRSRRSRLRWERRSAEAGRSTDDNSEERREQSERMETVGAEGSEDRVKTEETEVVNESEELFSCDDSESPSLLLEHWNTCGQTETGGNKGNEKEGQQELREKDAELTCWNAAIHTEEREQDGAKNGTRTETEGGEEGGNSREQRDGRLYEDGSNKDTEKNAAEQIKSEKSHVNTAEIKEEKSELVVGARDVKGVSLMDSCTLVEGLLYPAEYYVRTTRRMTLSQSQPDMQAVALSQLSMERRRRSRGRGSNRRSHDRERPDEHAPTGLSSPTSASAGPRTESPSADASAEPNSRSSGEISGQISACQIDTEGCFPPAVAAARPARGRKRRGRGRGRPQTPRCPLSLDTRQQIGLGQTAGDPQPTSSPVSSSPSLHGADGPKPCITPGEAVPVPDDPEPASTATQPSSGGNASQPSSASGRLKTVFPIFLKTTNGCMQMRSAASWRSLLLPSSPPAPSPLLPLPSLFPGPLLTSLVNFDIPQDFHLPDDQFASLKLHKLRQVAVDSGVEHFTSQSYNTRGCNRRYDARCGSSPVMPLSLPLTLTPTISNSPHPTEAKQAAALSADLQNLSIVYKLMDKLVRQRSAEETPHGDITEIPGEQQIENLHPACQTRSPSTESVSVVQDCAADCVDQYEEQDTVSVDHRVKPQLQVDCANRPAGKESDYVTGPSDELQIKESSVLSSEERTDCPVSVHALEDQRSRNYRTEDKSIIRTLSFDCLLQKTPEEPSNSCTAAQSCNHNGAPVESPVQRLRVKSPAKDSKETSEPATSPPTDGSVANQTHKRHRVPSQLLLSPPLASAPCTLMIPHLPSSALLSSPTLPSLGLSPHPLRAALPPTSSPAAPALTLPPAQSPATRALSPPELSPRPPSPPSRPTTSPAARIKASSEPSCADDQSHRVEPPNCPTLSSVRSQGPGGRVETAEEHMMRCTHTLKAPAGGCLVDACCLRGSSGALCVAAAGAWAVCLWSQTSAADWTLTHTWAFNKPVISVFPVPNAAGLMCVTLGQLEIREVRMLSCSSLSQALLCEGVVQAVVGVSRSRVVTSSHSASGSTLRVFTPSDSGSTSSSQPLVSPGVCVGALAPVDALVDALIGSSVSGHLFVWNLKTGQLLRRITLGDGLSHMACLRGFSSCGVLFVLLQHQLLSSLEDEATEKDGEKAALFSLVAVNPLSGKSALASRLHPPKAWSGRLCEADVGSSSVVAVSQGGCVCVWELGRRGASRTVVARAPDGEGWQLARWGEGGTLVTGHHNGDVTLHCRSPGQTSLCDRTR